MKYKAFLFDLNGTMVDDMPYHVDAWHKILTELGATISIEKTREECYGKNSELLERVFPGRFSEEEKERIGAQKEKKYQEEFKPRLRLLDGLDSFLAHTKKAGIKMAIGSAAIMSNINFVIDGLHIRHYFDAVISADQVTLSKPEPETFMRCAEELGMSSGDCLVFEDAPKGVESAVNAGMDCVVLTTLHPKEEFKSFPNVVSFAKDYRDLVIS